MSGDPQAAQALRQGRRAAIEKGRLNIEMQVESVLEQLYFTTARLEAFGPNGGSVGTGFLYGVKASGPALPGRGGDVHVLVTNKHVLEGATRLRVTMVRRSEGNQPVLGEAWQATIEDVTSALWTGHPDPEIDVAVLPFTIVLNVMQEQTGTVPYFVAITPDIALTPARATELDAVEEVLFIGYPRGLFDSVNLLPVARRGTTASPIAVDYEGKPQFMIDASVFPGSSGSPVFIANVGGYGDRRGNFNVATRVIFLGIIASSHVYRDIAEVLPLPTEGKQAAVVEAFLNLGMVFKAAALDQTVDVFLEANGHQRVVA